MYMIKDASGYMLLQKIKQMPSSITELHIDNCNLRSMPPRYFLEIMALSANKFKHIEKLVIDGSCFKYVGEGITVGRLKLLLSLFNNSSLKHLSLPNYELATFSEKNALTFMNLLASLSITKLSLPNNRLYGLINLHYDRLFAPLKHSKITTLDLSDNLVTAMPDDSLESLGSAVFKTAAISCFTLSPDEVKDISKYQYNLLYQYSPAMRYRVLLSGMSEYTGTTDRYKSKLSVFENAGAVDIATTVMSFLQKPLVCK